MLKIEKWVLMKPKTWWNNECKKLMDTMEIWESFWTQDLKIRNTASAYRLQLKPKKFSVLKQDWEYRCWRVS